MNDTSPPAREGNVRSGAVSTRPASASDRDFLFQLYASTRREEMEPWGWTAEQQMGFLRGQFEARRASYAAAYPTAEESILLDAGVPVGAITVSRAPLEYRLVDIALLPEHRNRGMGPLLISFMIRESLSSKAPLRLSVLRGNPAFRLYERLGFVVTTAEPMYIEMEHKGHVGEP
jgi:ribosomal protein S18 acetylase RimI-like enzyme